MKFSKEDQNTFLMIITILVVSIITIIVILNLIWSLLAKPVNNVLGSFTTFFKQVEVVDYNFPIPESPVVVIPEPEVLPVAPVEEEFILDYKESQILSAIFKKSEIPILKEAEQAKFKTSNKISQIKFQVNIESINLSSPALLGQNAEEILERGFYIYPGSNVLGDGDLILMCYREFFNSNDPRSCWHLDKLRVEEIIILKNDEYEMKYKIVEKKIISENDSSLYSIDTNSKNLKIITNYKEGNIYKRLLVIAQPSV